MYIYTYVPTQTYMYTYIQIFLYSYTYNTVELAQTGSGHTTEYWFKSKILKVPNNDFLCINILYT